MKQILILTCETDEMYIYKTSHQILKDMYKVMRLNKKIKPFIQISQGDAISVIMYGLM